MDKQDNTVKYYEYQDCAETVIAAIRDALCKGSFFTVKDLEKATNLLRVAKVLMLTYEIEWQNHMAEVKAKEAAAAQKALEEEERNKRDFAEVFGE